MSLNSNQEGDEGFTEAGGATDVAGAAERIKEEVSGEPESDRPRNKGGRPRGSKNRKARGSSAKSAPEPDEPVVVTEQDILGYTALGAAVWKFGGKMLGYRELTPEEATEFGTALAPVAKKWLPMLDTWQHEIALLVVIVSLHSRTKQERVVRDVQAEGVA